MTDYTREDMRERIARVVCRGDVRRHYDPAPDVGDLWADATDHGRSEWLNDADAIKPDEKLAEHVAWLGRAADRISRVMGAHTGSTKSGAKSSAPVGRTPQWGREAAGWSACVPKQLRRSVQVPAFSRASPCR